MTYSPNGTPFHLHPTDAPLSREEAQALYSRVASESAQVTNAAPYPLGKLRFLVDGGPWRSWVSLTVAAGAIAFAIITVYVSHSANAPQQLRANSKTQSGQRSATAPTSQFSKTSHTPPYAPAFSPRRWAMRLSSFGGGYTARASAVSLGAARARAGYPVQVPTSPLALSSAIRKIWLVELPGSEENIVALEYPKLEIITAPVLSTFDAPSTYVQRVRHHVDRKASIEVVNGVTAYVAPSYADDHKGRHPGYVAYTKHGVQTTIEGYYPEADLLAIARSLR